MQTHSTSEISLAMISLSIGVGKIMELLVKAEPILASLSYIVAIIAGLITIYYKFKRKG